MNGRDIGTVVFPEAGVGQPRENEPFPVEFAILVFFHGRHFFPIRGSPCARAGISTPSRLPNASCRKSGWIDSQERVPLSDPSLNVPRPQAGPRIYVSLGTVFNDQPEIFATILDGIGLGIGQCLSQ